MPSKTKGRATSKKRKTVMTRRNCPGSDQELFRELRIGLSNAVKKHRASQHAAKMKYLADQNVRAQRALDEAKAERTIREKQLKVRQLKAQVAKTRRSAGMFTVGERVSGTAKGVGSSAAALHRGLTRGTREYRAKGATRS